MRHLFDRPESKLRLIRTVHTLVWAFFATCIFAIPYLALRGHLGSAGVMIGIVFLEVVILALNDGHCPLTPLAARFTDDRRDNFDIYLPEWLAHHNKLIFGTLYVAGAALTLLLMMIER